MDIKFEVVHTHTLIALAAAGMGVGTLPKIALPLTKDLRAAAIANPALIRTVSIVTLNGQSLSPAGRALTDAIRKCLKRQT